MPEHKAEFQNNTKAYIKKIEKIDKEFREVVAGAKHKEIIFADKFPLKYFAKEYGLNIMQLLPAVVEIQNLVPKQ